MTRHPLYDLGRNAGRAAGQTDADTAAYLRSLTDPDSPEQTAGYIDGLTETRPEPAADDVSWSAVARARMRIGGAA